MQPRLPKSIGHFCVRCMTNGRRNKSKFQWSVFWRTGLPRRRGLRRCLQLGLPCQINFIIANLNLGRITQRILSKPICTHLAENVPEGQWPSQKVLQKSKLNLPSKWTYLKTEAIKTVNTTFLPAATAAMTSPYSNSIVESDIETTESVQAKAGSPCLPTDANHQVAPHSQTLDDKTVFYFLMLKYTCHCQFINADFFRSGRSLLCQAVMGGAGALAAFAAKAMVTSSAQVRLLATAIMRDVACLTCLSPMPVTAGNRQNRGSLQRIAWQRGHDSGRLTLEPGQLIWVLKSYMCIIVIIPTILLATKYCSQFSTVCARYHWGRHFLSRTAGP